MDQLELHIDQNDFLTQAIVPKSVRDGLELPTNFVLRYDYSPQVPRADKVSGIACKSSGLSTKDLRDYIYPALKYHVLYCDPEVRKVAPDTQGRVAVKIDRIDFLEEITHKELVLSVSFDGRWIYHSNSSGPFRNFLIPDESSAVFVFNIERPPPYTVKIAVKTKQGEVVAKLTKAFPIRKLTTQGSQSRLVQAEYFKPPIISARMSWAVYVPTSEMFLPELGGRGLVATESLQPGTGHWGDLAVFDPLSVDLDRQSMALERERFLLSADENENLFDEPAPSGSGQIEVIRCNALDRPRSFCGLNKALLEGILFFSYPSLVYCVEVVLACHVRNGEGQVQSSVVNTVTT